MRAGELAALTDDAMIHIGDTFWLRIPIGKLHNDRYVPLHPILVELITNYRATRPTPRSNRLVERDDGQPFERRTIHRYVTAVAKRAGVGPVHPHQLRHTLATRAINRGMSLEAIAALLGHRTMRMTLVYARISDRTVADEYFRVTEAVEANYHNADPLPANVEGTNMHRLAADHQRLLGNGHCTRPATLDCNFETTANDAASSTPDQSSSPSSSANETTPPNATNTTAPNSSPAYSTTSTTSRRRDYITPSPQPLDHPYNNTFGRGRTGN